jgi:hypothetical protein
VVTLAATLRHYPASQLAIGCLCSNRLSAADQPSLFCAPRTQSARCLQAECVAITVCFAHYLATAGDCREEAMKLSRQALRELQERRDAKAERVAARRAAKEARAAERRAGDLADEDDLEDSDVDDEDEELDTDAGAAAAAAKLLAAPSLSKLVSEFIDAHEGKAAAGGDANLDKLAQALRALTSEARGVDATVAWYTNQVCPC